MKLIEPEPVLRSFMRYFVPSIVMTLSSTLQSITHRLPVVGVAGLVLLASGLDMRAAGKGELDFYAKVSPIFRAHCYECHNYADDKGGINLEQYSTYPKLFENLSHLERIRDAVDFEEMPPSEKEPLTEQQREDIVAWVDYLLEHGVRELDPDPGPSVIRRLTRSEYSRTVRDLFKIDFDVTDAVGMPEDAISEGYDNVATALTIPPLLMEKYFDAALEVVDRYFYENHTGRDIAGEIDERVSKGLVPAARRNVARQIFMELLPRAFRRPVTDAEVERYMYIYDRGISLGRKPSEAFRYMVVGALMSPNFLFRIEQDQKPSGSKDAYPVTDFELATRLSYFLWSSMPDDELFRLASERKLSNPTILEQQVKRMLADPRASSLAEVFAEQWLELDMLDEARPSTDFFPDYTEEIRHAMKQETIAFMDNLRKTNGNILDMLDSDYTFLNGPLAEFYGVPGVEGENFQKVALGPDSKRGGLVTMGSILSMNSHTYRTSPTLRGTWVLSIMLGSPPPPPPANASQLTRENEEKAAAETFRQVLALHAADPSCASCHRKIDPLGFGLENFDPVGRWREEDRGENINATGELPSGETFTGSEELKNLLLEKKDRFTESLTEQMLAFALGRELKAVDRPVVTDIATKVKASGYRFHVLINEIAKSFPFRYRKNYEVRPDANPPDVASVTTPTEP